MTIIDQYNKFAGEFDEFGSETPGGRITLFKILNEIELEKKNVIDLGCGSGDDLTYFQQQGSNLYGVDSSKEILKLAKEKVPGADLRNESFDNLSHDNNSFDLVFSRYAVQHQRSIQNMFSEVYRVLKPGGDFVFLAVHPIRHFFEKKGNNYWSKELIQSEIFNKKMVVEEYSHTMEEYFSPTVLNSFEIKQFTEEHDVEAEVINGMTYPSYMIMHLQKKQ